MDAGGAAGFVDLLVGGGGVGVLEVVHEGFVEKDGVLRHDADVPAERVDGDVFHVVAVDLDASVTEIIEAEEKAEDCGFAAA